MKKVSIIFDSNILYIEYKKSTDYNKFYFNRTLENVIREIEKLELDNICEILIPTVVWEEIKKQKIEAYHKEVKELRERVEKNQYPNFSYKLEEFNYEEHLQNELIKYKDNMKDKIKQLELPSNKCFKKIISKAFNKEAPFIGVNKQSDKGFKDALIWESILEYKKNNKNRKIIFYTNDDDFNEIKEEFEKIFNNFEEPKIEIFKAENDLINFLKENAEKWNPDSHVDKEDEYSSVRQFVLTDMFREELKKVLLAEEKKLIF